jgi:biopolymer transport protein ExbB
MSEIMSLVHTVLQWGMVGMLAKGGAMMLPLFAASVTSLTVIIERGVFWRRLRQHEVDTAILQYVAAGEIEQAITIAHASSHPVARVLSAGLAYQHQVPRMAMEAAAQAEVQRVKAYLPVLDTIITLAPLLGLLGTITGMISAFGLVSETGLGQPQAITGGVAEALIATATGLCVALMTLLPYNYFRAKVEHVTERMEEQATRLELFLNQRGA